MSEGQHQVITTISEITAIFIRCVCGEQVILKRRSLESTMSGVFCRKCDEQYWIRWSEGVLNRGFVSHEELASARRTEMMEEYTDEQTGMRLTVECDYERDYPVEPRITVVAPEGCTLSTEEVNAAIRRLVAMAGFGREPGQAPPQGGKL